MKSLRVLLIREWVWVGRRGTHVLYIVCIRLNVLQSGNEGLYGTLQFQSTYNTEHWNDDEEGLATTERTTNRQCRRFMTCYGDLICITFMHFTHHQLHPSRGQLHYPATDQHHPPQRTHSLLDGEGGRPRAMHSVWLTDPPAFPLFLASPDSHSCSRSRRRWCLGGLRVYQLNGSHEVRKN